MKREFKKGDRVKVRLGGRAAFKGTVDAVTGETSIQVIEDGCYSVHADAPFHPCQLVPLKPKKKLERLRVRSIYPSLPPRNIEMIELRPGEAIVSYEDLAKAWDATVSGLLSEHSSHFKALSKALGLSPESKGEK